MEQFPLARQNEIEKIMEYINPQETEKIVEIGTGNGILTIPLGQQLKKGRLFTLDVKLENIHHLREKILNYHNYLPISTYTQDPDYNLDFPDCSMHKIATIAALHHHDNTKNQTGHKGKQKIIQELYRILKPNGKLIIADIAQEATTQKYFDEIINNPRNIAYGQPEGHPHEPFSRDLAFQLLKSVGFKKISYKIESVPWQFQNQKEAEKFLHKLHNAHCSPQESFQEAKKYLGFTQKKSDLFEMKWELCYITAKKPRIFY